MATPSIWKLFCPGVAPLTLISRVPLPKEVALFTRAVRASRQADNLREIPAGQRQLSYGGAADHGAQRGTGGLQGFGRGFDGDLLGLRADFQSAIQRRTLRHVEGHGADFGCLEAGRREAHLVTAWRKQRELILRRRHPVVAVRTCLVSLLVRVTVTFGMAAPDGSVIVPLRPDVPADCAIKDGTQIANIRIKTANTASCVQSSVLDLIIPFSL